MRLSFCILTTGASGRVAAILEHVRPVADELVVAVDEGVPPGEVAALADRADVVVRFPLREPIDRATPWVFSLCSGDWILTADHDEIPSLALLEALPGLLAAEDVTHYEIARRWLWPDAAHCLDEPPWGRERVPKLVRNDPLAMRFSDVFHRPFVFQGPNRNLDVGLWHADFLLQPYESRRAKALAYERARRGIRIAGVAHNSGFYLPELRPEARTAALPEAERALVERILAAPAPSTGEPRAVPRATGEEVDRVWPGGWREGGDLHRGRVEPVEQDVHLTAGVQQTVEVRVVNESDRTWGYGGEARPEIRLAYRWPGAADPADPALRTSLPADLAPGESQLVPIHVVPPREPGRHRLEIDLVHEHVTWFGVGFALDVEVVSRRRVALLGAGSVLTDELDRLQLEPVLEPVLLLRDDDTATAEWHHLRAPALRAFMLDGTDGLPRPRLATMLRGRTRALSRRARKLRRGEAARPLAPDAEAFLAALAGCDRLVLAGRDWPEDAPAVRELWRLAAIVRAAEELGVEVEERPGALDGFGRRVETALVRDVRKRVGARVAP